MSKRNEELRDFVPYSKASKKEKRKRDKEQRNDWGDINPNTKVIPDKRRKKEKHKRDNYYDEE